MVADSGNNAHSPKGLNKILESPWVFNFWQQITGAEKWKRRIINEFVKPFAGARILDIGCGTGAMLKHIDKILSADYVGCDPNTEYIDYARKKFEESGKFYCCSADNLPNEESGFDFVLCIAVFHHLNDKACTQLIESAKKKLNPKGMFVIAEPVWTETQSAFEKRLMKNDRGINIKTENEYLLMLKEKFSFVESTIISDSHIIPWTVSVITCTNVS